MAWKPVFFSAVFSVVPVPSAYADLSNCRLEVVDMVTLTAAVNCGEEAILLEPGEDFQGLTIANLSHDKVTFSDTEGGVVLWYIAAKGKPSRVKYIVESPPEDTRGSREHALGVMPGESGSLKKQ